MSKKENNIPESENTMEKEYSILNLGPTHPATHGIFQNILKMGINDFLVGHIVQI